MRSAGEPYYCIIYFVCLSEGVNLIISIQSMFLQLTTIFRTFILVKGTGTLNCIFVSPTNIM